MVRKFLYFIVFCILGVAAVLFALRLYSEELTRVALVPDSQFVSQEQLADNAYNDPAMWLSRPGKDARSDPARWEPAQLAQPRFGPVADDNPATDRPAAMPAEADNALASPDAAVFFVHPTSFIDRTRWNAPLDDAASQERARLMVRGMASPFNQAAEIWVPRYRQATFGAFLTDQPEADQAIALAYEDISLAFDAFIDAIPQDRPIVLAGHSQGALLIMRLMQERIARTALRERIAVAYPIGWPISLDHDLPALGLPACMAAQQTGCIVTWASFADPAEPGMFLRRYSTTTGLDGAIRGEDDKILCVNPLTGEAGGSASTNRNLGTLVPSDDLSTGELIAGAVPARCAENGLLLIGNPPQLGAYVFPGNNYHVYDIPLFWQNLQFDFARRVAAFAAGSGA